MPNLYKYILRPILFTLQAETAQKLAENTLQVEPLWKSLEPYLKLEDSALSTKWCGFQLKNPIGLAAGFDKECRLLPSLSHWGFGYLVAGTVTAKAKPGNPRPRMFRNPSNKSLVNALGFPGQGLIEARRELEGARKKIMNTPIVVSVSGTDISDVVNCYQAVEPLADAIEVNISSPNTKGLRLFHKSNSLSKLLYEINQVRNKPLIIKLPPYTTENLNESEGILSLIRTCRDNGVDGLTISNTQPVKDDRLSVKEGGLSGRPIYAKMLNLVRDARKEVGPEMAINACGGIFTGYHALQAMEAGATTVQIYTGIVFRGPRIVKHIKEEMLNRNT